MTQARARMSAVADVAIVSLGTTFGWRRADEALAAMLEEAGCVCEVAPVRIGRAAGSLRRTMAMTDLVEALAARRAAATVSARTVIFSSITAALLQRPAVPYAVRFDTVAELSRPGVSGAWQRRREPTVLSQARLLLPWSETAAQTAARLIERGNPRLITLPVPIEPLQGAARRDITAVAYAAHPAKRGLDLLCTAWRQAGPPDGMLVVGGLDRDKAMRYLREAGVEEPPSVQWAGALLREEWLALLARAQVFINASRYEDWGIAQMEALSSGTPLVTVPTPGPNEALSLARRLAPELVAPGSSPAALAHAIEAGLRLGNRERAEYRSAADALLGPYRPEAVQRIVTHEVVPALLRSSS